MHRSEQRLPTRNVVFILYAVADVAAAEIPNAAKHRIEVFEGIHDRRNGRDELGALDPHVAAAEKMLERRVNFKKVLVEAGCYGLVAWRQFCKAVADEGDLAWRHQMEPSRYRNAITVCAERIRNISLGPEYCFNCFNYRGHSFPGTNM